MKKILLSTSLALAFTSLLAGCGTASKTTSSKSSQPVTVTVAFDGTEITTAEINKWNKAHPNIQIKYEDVGTAGKLQALMASGNTPDIIRIQAASELGNYIDKGIAMNLQSYFNEPSSKKYFNQSDFESVVNEYRYNTKTGQQGTGDLYGFPKDWSQDFTVWINKSIFQKAGIPLPSTTQPMTWDQLEALGKKLTVTNSKGKVTQYGLGYYNGDTEAEISLLLLQYGQLGQSPWTDNYQKANFDTPLGIKLLTEWDNAVKENLGPNPLNQDPNGAVTLFMDGQMAMMISGFWYLGDINSEVGQKVNGKPFNANNFEMVPAPQEPGGKRMSPTGAAVGGIIYSGTKHPQQAWQVFEYLFGNTDAAGQGKGPADDRASDGWGLTAFKSKMSEEPNTTPLEKEVNTVEKKELKYASPFLQYNPYVDLTAVDAAITKYMTPVYYGKSTVQAAAQQIDSSLDTLIQQGMQDLGK